MTETVLVVPAYPHFLTILFLIWLAGVLIGWFSQWAYTYYQRTKENDD